MIKNPLISIIIPCFNREDFIEKTIDSVVAQSYENWECIVVDDGSTDKSAEKIKDYCLKNSKIRYIEQSNQERCIARNNGIKYSSGDYLAFLDSDDIWLKNHLEEFIRYLSKQENKCCLFFSKVYYCENDEINLKIESDLNNNNVFHYILTETFNTSRIIIHKKVAEEFNFDPMVPGVEDLDISLRIATKYPIKQMPEATVHYYLGDQSYTMSDTKKWEKELTYFRLIERKKELKKILPRKSIRRLKSACHFHIGLLKYQTRNRINSLFHLISAFFLYPSGYNGRNNKILFVHVIYNIPILGTIIKSMISFIKYH